MRGIGRRGSRWIGGQRGFYGSTLMRSRISVVYLIFFLGIIISLVTGRIELVLGWTAVFLVLWLLGFIRI
jgi:hypothetical protein